MHPPMDTYTVIVPQAVLEELGSVDIGHRAGGRVHKRNSSKRGLQSC